MKCLSECKLNNSACEEKNCRMWIDYKKEFNCCLETVEKNGALTLREIADRLGVSFVRVKQIQDKALEKLNKSAFNNLIY
jgi:hypothetical protein|tara:strand:+ start:618 stop:857 length:240 start_codon:yes stop_codon:yes gene_type:complete